MTRYFLACRLKYSRWTWVMFTNEMRQETLFRGLVACFNALGFVPWVLVFDNMKTVTTGRDDQEQPIWHPALLQLAAEFDFHPEACWPGAGNQKGSVESVVKFVKINFLAGRSFIDDADLQAQCVDWQERSNTTRASQATDVTPASRLVEEVAKGYPLPSTATDYGFAARKRRLDLSEHDRLARVAARQHSQLASSRQHRLAVGATRDHADRDDRRVLQVEWDLHRSHTSDLSHAEWLDWTNGVWIFGAEQPSRVSHPAPFPEELPRRLIKLFSYPCRPGARPLPWFGDYLGCCLPSRSAVVRLRPFDPVHRRRARSTPARGRARQRS